MPWMRQTAGGGERGDAAAIELSVHRSSRSTTSIYGNRCTRAHCCSRRSTPTVRRSSLSSNASTAGVSSDTMYLSRQRQLESARSHSSISESRGRLEHALATDRRPASEFSLPPNPAQPARRHPCREYRRAAAAPSRRAARNGGSPPPMPMSVKPLGLLSGLGALGGTWLLLLQLGNLLTLPSRFWA